MRARWAIPLLVASGAAVAGEPKPATVDVKPFRDQLLVLQDADGGTYVVLPGKESRAWFGTGKTLYEQVVVTRSSNGETGSWQVGTWAPRIPRLQPGAIIRSDEGTYFKNCGDSNNTPLTVVTADRAKAMLDKLAFLSTALTRKAFLLARDDSGVYYYIDTIREQYGGSGYRVFVGKKGAMKQMPLLDVATDTGGQVFSTKSGDVRFVHDAEPEKRTTWVHGEKHTALIQLDVDVNSPLIFKDLGVYSFLGTICDAS